MLVYTHAAPPSLNRERYENNLAWFVCCTILQWKMVPFKLNNIVTFIFLRELHMV